MPRNEYQKFTEYYTAVKPKVLYGHESEGNATSDLEVDLVEDLYGNNKNIILYNGRYYYINPNLPHKKRSLNREELLTEQQSLLKQSSISDFQNSSRYISGTFIDNNLNGTSLIQNDFSSEASNLLNTANVVRNLNAFGRFLEILQAWPLPRFSLTTTGLLFLVTIFFSPRTCVHYIIFPIFRLLFGVLHPAYSSYKAVRTKHIKEYVKWMMYWIVFAFFTCIESVTDIFCSWLPLYYEAKVVIVIWLLSPATNGSSLLYRKFVHPILERREEEIDKYLNEAKERGYSAVIQLGSKGVSYATNVIMNTALKGGGNLVQTLKRSYSLSDLSEPDTHRSQDEIDQVIAMRPQQRILRSRQQAAIGRSSSGSRHSTGMYFSEVDVTPKDINYYIRSSDDISSGYSSAEVLPGGLSRTSSLTNASKNRVKGRRTETEQLQNLNLCPCLALRDVEEQICSNGQRNNINYITIEATENENLPIVLYEQSNASDNSILSAAIASDDEDFQDALSTDSYVEDNTIEDSMNSPIKINTKELNNILYEIKENFRAHLESHQEKTYNDKIKNNNNYNTHNNNNNNNNKINIPRRRALHSKGKAPPPPINIEKPDYHSARYNNDNFVTNNLGHTNTSCQQDVPTSRETSI